MRRELHIRAVIWRDITRVLRLWLEPARLCTVDLSLHVKFEDYSGKVAVQDKKLVLFLGDLLLLVAVCMIPCFGFGLGLDPENI